MNEAQLYWLPKDGGWRKKLMGLRAESADAAWPQMVALANTCLDFVATNALDNVAQSLFHNQPLTGLAHRQVRMAILGSSTLSHLHAPIRVAGLRRGIWITTYECDYGQYMQDLLDPDSPLHAFKPDVVLFAWDAHHLMQGLSAGMGEAEAAAFLESVTSKIGQCWGLARDAFQCPIIQQTLLPSGLDLLGNNEHRLPGSGVRMVTETNIWLRAQAEKVGIDLLAIDRLAEQIGARSLSDSALWHRSKQDISPKAAPLYGDMVARIVAAQQGRSYKCLVCDLDNTLWGGVIGDDGLDGIVIGQGSALGEAHLALQRYLLDLSQRGILLAVCSKNDEHNAWEPFDKHPEMLLKRQNIACFVANWQDKPANIRHIAETLNIGLDSLVFLDDNPLERDIVRQNLPMVAVPEIGEDPSLYAEILADAGYFEGLMVTAEDRERVKQYHANRERESLRQSATDLEGYLNNLHMTLYWKRFDQVGLKRTAQLINKTNQFNLTTRRYTENDVLAVMNDPDSIGLQLRLADKFGDNGIIGIIIGKKSNDDLVIDTWLMSCRVLGRKVEQATLNLIVEQAQRFGARRLVGDYIPTAKNGMVRDHYRKLGFTETGTANDNRTRNVMTLDNYKMMDTPIIITEG